jgi:hypothetical protein
MKIFNSYRIGGCSFLAENASSLSVRGVGGLRDDGRNRSLSHWRTKGGPTVASPGEYQRWTKVHHRIALASDSEQAPPAEPALVTAPQHPDAALFALKQIEDIISTRAVTTEGLMWKARLWRRGTGDHGLAGSLIEDLLAMKGEPVTT